MSKMQIYSQKTPFSANAADTDYVLGVGNIVTSTTAGIDATSAVSGRTFLINGEIAADQYGMVLGKSATPSPSVDITIGETGAIHATASGIVNYSGASKISNAGVIVVQGAGLGGGQYGIYSVGDNNHISNSGHISSIKDGIYTEGDGDAVSNSGTISATYGIQIGSVSGEKNTVINSGTILATSAIAVNGGSGDENVVNSGKIYGSVFLGSGDEKVVNSGKIYGSVFLSDGEDTYVSKGGFVTGPIYGGDGNDTYVLDKAGINVSEKALGGIGDTVRASVSFTLGDNVEYLTLAGKADLKGHGNALDNGLRGNLGDNRLFGLDGADVLQGGKGTDILTGGSGSDIFVFRPHVDKEIITDFVDGIDQIGFFAGKDVTSVGDLIKHHAHNDGDNLVISGDGTEMILKNMHKSDLDASDFIF
jgi:Ca2+-binding RTX toxin-like protein